MGSAVDLLRSYLWVLAVARAFDLYNMDGTVSNAQWLKRSHTLVCGRDWVRWAGASRRNSPLGARFQLWPRSRGEAERVRHGWLRVGLRAK